jgi:hypothetical protein
MAIAFNSKVSLRLTKFGISSAAVRLPAETPAMRALSAYAEMAHLISVIAPSHGINIGDAHSQLARKSEVYRAMQASIMGAADHVSLSVGLEELIQKELRPFAEGTAMASGFMTAFHESWILPSPRLLLSTLLLLWRVMK